MKTASLLRRLLAPTLLLAAEVALACSGSVVLTGPAAAQFWDFPFWGRRPAPQQRQWSPWNGWQSGPEQRPQQQPVDASRAPPPRKPETPPSKTVLVMGDSMADWLGFGLEDALAESPEFGVTRKFRAYSGLIRGEARKDFDWPQSAKEILAAEKPDFVVMMIGTSDRQTIRERAPRAAPKQVPGTQPKQDGQPAAADKQEGEAGAEQQKSREQPKAAEQPKSSDPKSSESKGSEQKGAEPQKPAASAEPLGPMMTYEFRSEKWGEAYGRRIDEMIAVLKSKNVPVLWVGLPAIRGPRATSDIAYLNELYRGHAEKAGVIYVDVWDGFVDENGNYTARGPDFEGQTRLLRAGDGVHFTKYGARKLAHYVEREIRHAMLSRGVPMANPIPEEPQPDAAAHPGPAARPVAGPVVPLALPVSASEGLVGAGTQRPAVPDPNANRVLVKGEPLGSISGRADDFAWPRPNASTEPEPQPAASPAETKSGASPAGAPPASAPKPAAAPASKKPPSPAAAAEQRRPLSLNEDHPRPEQARRRPPADDAPRPPGAIPLAPIH